MKFGRCSCMGLEYPSWDWDHAGLQCRVQLSGSACDTGCLDASACLHCIFSLFGTTLTDWQFFRLNVFQTPLSGLGFLVLLVFARGIAHAVTSFGIRFIVGQPIHRSAGHHLPSIACGAPMVGHPSSRWDTFSIDGLGRIQSLSIRSGWNRVFDPRTGRFNLRFEREGYLGWVSTRPDQNRYETTCGASSAPRALRIPGDMRVSATSKAFSHVQVKTKAEKTRCGRVAAAPRPFRTALQKLATVSMEAKRADLRCELRWHVHGVHAKNLPVRRWRNREGGRGRRRRGGLERNAQLSTDGNP